MAPYHVSIFRDADGFDCTRSGVSSKFTAALLYRDAADIPADPPGGVALLVLDARPVSSLHKQMRRVRAVPAGETGWTMFGGNFVWSCDSRFRREVSELPIPIHDRVER